MKQQLLPSFPAGNRFVLSIGCCVILALGAANVQAQDQDAAKPDSDAGRSLMERGADLFFEGLKREMAPTLDEAARLFSEIGPSMRSFLAEMGPALSEIAEKVEDWSVYERPEILPNGDIILRRKEPLPEDKTPKGSEPTAAPDGSIEL